MHTKEELSRRHAGVKSRIDGIRGTLLAFGRQEVQLAREADDDGHRLADKRLNMYRQAVGYCDRINDMLDHIATLEVPS